MNIYGIEKTLLHIRTSILEEIIALMRKYECTEINCAKSDLVVIPGYDNDSYSYYLTKITLTPDGIMVYYSNRDDNDFCSLRGFDTDTMLEIAKWLYDNENYLF